MREFHPHITDIPARRNELVPGEYTWKVEEDGDGPVAVKIVDVLAATTTGPPASSPEKG